MTQPSRPRLLFLSPIYPSGGGTGNQLRTAAIVQLLAQSHDIDLVVITRHDDVRGPRDPAVERACRAIYHLNMKRPEEIAEPGKIVPPMGFVPLPQLPVDPSSPTPLLDYFQAQGMDALFVFTLLTALVVKNYLDRFPIRDLDLDEMPSAREDKICRLDLIAGNPRAQRERSLQARLMGRVEGGVIPIFNRVFVASEIERARVLRETTQRHVAVLPNILPVRPVSKAPAISPAPEDGDEILFVGSLNYPPNEDAVLHFARDIFPRIRAGAPRPVSFRIVGTDCTPALRKLESEPGIMVTGYVDDLVPIYRRARLAVVPLRAGGGTRLKILEAFFHGCPVVSTTLGAEGLEIVADRDLLLADSAEAFAQACLDLLQNPEKAALLIENGAAYVREKHSPATLAAAYRAALAAPRFHLTGCHGLG
jgi:glycosyltransferase involved in cell wall biosynthesis